MQEPIAVVGIGCRFPGIINPAAFWHAICHGIDGISELSARRRELGDFTEMSENDPHRWGGFLQDIDRFDAPFFSIPPREAAHLDPQYRLLLEVAWEALEDAGWVPESLSGTRAGVFIGMSYQDYAHLVFAQPIEDAIASTGTSTCMAANRLSYFFNLRGPSVVMNTACSSSLVALDRACQSLWLGESTVALAGGVNLMLRSQSTLSLAKAGLLSKTGRCRTFNADADGYVRSEGVGLIALKPLSQAQADGDRIYAVIRSSSTNSNGRSNGISAPNPQAQEDLLRFTYARAGVDPATIDYVEVQGTGTQMGDALELKALGAVLAEGDPRERPCAVGTVKTNIGHTESAAGIAGAIEAILALYHRQLPPNLHVHTPNPLVPFETLPLVVQETLAPWPQSDRPARAGVSAFGFGGTNAHALLEEAPVAPARRIPASPQAYLLTLSAKNESALRSLAGRYQERLTEPLQGSLADLCATANARRSEFKHRFTTVARSAEAFQARLAAFASGTMPNDAHYAKLARRERTHVTFVFSGQGDRWSALGKYMYATQSAFKNACDRCFNLLHPDRKVTNWDMWLTSQPPKRDMAFVVEYAFACTWQQWGVQPASVMGIGGGKWVAACTAGILTLAEAIALASRKPDDDLPAIAPQPPTIPWLDPATGSPAIADRLVDREFWLADNHSVSAPALADLTAIALAIGSDLVDLDRPAASSDSSNSATVDARDAWHHTLEAIAALWRAGIGMHWSEVYPTATYQPLTLPTYAFDRQSYWVARPTAPQPSPSDATPAASADASPAIAYERPDIETSFVAPRNDTEQRLATIWKTLFGLERVGVRDSFFDLGGDSLLSVRLFSDIEKTFHCQLSLADISGNLTVETLAVYLRQQGAMRAPSQPDLLKGMAAPHGMSAIDFHTLLSLSAGRKKRRVGDRGLLCEFQAGDGTTPPLIAIGAKLGKWAEEFGQHQTVYCLPSTWMFIRKPRTYIQSLAALYADEIQSAQPQGPYFLIGYCFEGWVAFEVAHQLRDRGQDIGMLAILDSDAPYPDPFHQKLAKSQLKYNLALSRHLIDEWRAHLGLKDMSAQAYRRQITPRIATALGHAIRNYQPRPYPGNVTLFLSTTYADRYEHDPQAGWGALVTGTLNVHRVEAKHLDVIQSPHKERAIEIVREHMVAALARSGLPSTGREPVEPHRVNSTNRALVNKILDRAKYFKKASEPTSSKR